MNTIITILTSYIIQMQNTTSPMQIPFEPPESLINICSDIVECGYLAILIPSENVIKKIYEDI